MSNQCPDDYCLKNGTGCRESQNDNNSSSEEDYENNYY